MEFSSLKWSVAIATRLHKVHIVNASFETSTQSAYVFIKIFSFVYFSDPNGSWSITSMIFSAIYFRTLNS